MNILNYKKYSELIKKYICDKYRLMFREGDGIISYPFIVPGSRYSNCLWDWDSYFTNVALKQLFLENKDMTDISEYEKGCVKSFLEHTSDEGIMPVIITPENKGFFDIDSKDTNMHKPCIAQHIAFILKYDTDTSWFMPYTEKLELFIKAYDRDFKHENGLYFWKDDLAIGVDNDPCTFFRPKKSSASVFLNSFMYKELSAMADIFIRLNIPDKAEYYKCKKKELALCINDKLWDEKDGFYYSADLNLNSIDKNFELHSGAPRHWDYLIQRIGVWSGILPLWAGIADKNKAKRVIVENYKDKKSFIAPYGIRTLSKYEKMYSLKKTDNPSCWLGPVWGISNYLTFRALLNYGYTKEAEDIALKTVELFGRDIDKCGEMHEYYDPETGEGINNPGFQNWNFLVLNMIAYLDGNDFITEY